MEPKKSKLERVAVAVAHNPDVAAGALVGGLILPIGGHIVGAAIGAGAGRVGRLIWRQNHPGE